VLEQDLSEAAYELIVVNDSGLPLLPAPWMDSERVRIIHTKCRDKSVARNAGAAIAQGAYLHFLDDDDQLLSGALNRFWHLSGANKAALLYGGTALVDRKGNPLIELHHNLAGNCFVQIMAGEWIPTGAYMVDASVFFAVGGYNPLMPAGEDSDLCRRIALRGAFAGMPDLVLCAGMGQQASTTDYGRLPAYSRRAREAILDEPGAFRRMRDSADNGYWKGRIVRAYLTSAIWNIQHKRLFCAASRPVFGLTSLILAGQHLFSADFWRALTKPYRSFTFARGFLEASS
jgi:glycosyltransferase involved in cell wall biosynthesis